MSSDNHPCNYKIPKPLKPKPMTQIKSTSNQLVALLFVLAAYLVPGLQTGDQIMDSMINFASFSPMVIFLAGFANTRLKWEGMKAFSLTGVVALILGYASYFLDHGFLAQSASLWWHPAVISLGLFASAVLGFNHTWVKTIAEIIFDYSFKNSKEYAYQTRPDTGENFIDHSGT